MAAFHTLRMFKPNVCFRPIADIRRLAQQGFQQPHHKAAANAGTTWQNGDLTTHSQVLWATDSSAQNVVINNFNAVYASNFGVLEVGIPGTSGYSIRLDSGAATFLFLPASGTIGPLTSDLFDPALGSPGAFGGEVVALELNVDFSDAGPLSSNGFVLGDLLVTSTGDAAFDGQTVRELLTEMNVALGGGAAIAPYSDLDTLAFDINGAFAGGTPSAFAQDHLTLASVATTVPEPGTWAMMLFGFGLIGGAMRSAKRRQERTASYA